MMKYEVFVFGESYGTVEQYILGQTDDEYLFLVKSSLFGTGETVSYELSAKRTMVTLTGKAEIQTIDGMKALSTGEYTIKQGGMTITAKAYFDQSSGLTYRTEIKMAGMVQELIEYEVVTQTSYKESEAIGTAYEYVSYHDGLKLDAKIKCVADGQDGKYWIALDHDLSTTGTEYFLSDYPQGLPADAEKTDTTALIDTIDGKVTVQILKYTSDAGEQFTFYIDSESLIIYRMNVKIGADEWSFDLTKKP
jgi:hypothetical protein